jgi:hypothetical protein
MPIDDTLLASWIDLILQEQSNDVKIEILNDYLKSSRSGLPMTFNCDYTTSLQDLIAVCIQLMCKMDFESTYEGTWRSEMLIRVVWNVLEWTETTNLFYALNNAFNLLWNKYRGICSGR